MSSGILNNDKELFLRIAENDEAAFRLLFEQYRERLFLFAWQLCHSAADSEEVVQDVFTRIWENREKLTAVESPRNYIYTMVRNRTLDLLSKIAKDKNLIKEVWANISEGSNETEQLLQAAESKQLIEKAVSQLSPKKRKVFQLSRDEGLSHQEIAAQLGISVQTVKNIITEVLRQIKSFLSEHSELLAILFWIQTYSLLFQ